MDWYDEVIARIRRNKNPKKEVIILIADFLGTNVYEAEKIYREEFGE